MSPSVLALRARPDGMRGRQRSEPFKAGSRPISSSSAPTKPAGWRRSPCVKATRAETGAPLFAVDADLQKADLQVQEATLKNAQQALRPRPAICSRPKAGNPKGLSRMRRRHCGPPRPGSTPRRDAAPTAARFSSPVTGSVEQIYFRVGEMVPSGKPVGGAAAAGQSQGSLLSSVKRFCRISSSAMR